MFEKIKNYTSLFYKEYKYRIVYIILFIIINIINITIYWNEILILLLHPLEKLILKNNMKIIYSFIADHYQLEDHTYLSTIDLKSLNIYNNEVPYFELNLSTTNSTDWLFLIIAGFFLILLVVPFCLYQASMFTAPILLNRELRTYNKKIFLYTIGSVILFFITSTTIISFLIKSYLVATQEIGYYEFEIEFSIAEYLQYYLSIILVQNSILFLFVTSRIKKENYLVMVSSFLFVTIFAGTLVLWVYYITYIIIMYTIKKLYIICVFLKYKHCIRMYMESEAN